MKTSRLETETEIEEFYNKYKNFKIRFAKDRCGNSPKFSFKKKITEDHFGYSHYQRRSSTNSFRNRRESSGDTTLETENFNRETIAEEAAMVFGIVHKDKEIETETEHEHEQDETMSRSTELVDVPEEADEGEDEGATTTKTMMMKKKKMNNNNKKKKTNWMMTTMMFLLLLDQMKLHLLHSTRMLKGFYATESTEASTRSE